MTEPDPRTPRSPTAMWFAAAPIATALALGLAALALALLVWRGGSAKGERVVMRFEGCPEAAPILEARATAIGLGDPRVSANPLTVEATLPGLPDDAVAIPALLTRPGTARVLRDGSILATEADLDLVEIELDERGMPYTSLDFGGALEGDPATLRLEVDGQAALAWTSAKTAAVGVVRLLPGVGTSRELMRVAADHLIALQSGPLPCAVTPLPGP